MADISDNIPESAAAPRSANIDGQQVQQHSLTDQIAADRYLKSAAAAKKGLGLRHVKLRPPSAADVDFTDNGSTSCP